jgi:hypothetical protein
MNLGLSMNNGLSFEPTLEDSFTGPQLHSDPKECPSRTVGKSRLMKFGLLSSGLFISDFVLEGVVMRYITTCF